MMALTITQPWASLIAVGAKRIETRSWPTKHRGPLAIHAAKSLPAEAREAFFLQPVRDALWSIAGSIEDLPRGAVIATVELADVIAIVNTSSSKYRGDIWLPPPSPERDFGNFARGRYAWILREPRFLVRPVAVGGRLGLWDWEQAA